MTNTQQRQPLKVYDPEQIDTVVQKTRVFSSGNLTKWDLISGIYCETSKTIDPDGKVMSGLDGVRDAWAAWAARQRYTHGWSDRTLMISDDVAIRFYKYPNCGEDDDGEPWDFMCDGFWVAQRQGDGSWAVLIDVPFCRTPETIGKRQMVSPWDGLLEPLQGDPRIEDGAYVSPMEAGLREPGRAEDCSLCQTLQARKYSDRRGPTAKVTCRPGYVVPIRPSNEPSPVFDEDELCWIAECELCATPMMISKVHNQVPTAEQLQAMTSKLRDVVSKHYGYEPWIDPANLRIPDHYHAHARPLNRLTGHAMNRPAVSLD